jgi:argininosuccinate synthase
VARVLLAFNGDLESRLALHWLAHEQGHEVTTLSVNLGQEIYLEPLGELALELGASKAQVVDRRETFLRDFAFPMLQADAVYQSGCFLGAALGRFVVAQELVRTAHEEECRVIAHSAASKGHDQVRMETAIAAQDPNLEVLAPARTWNLRTAQDKLNYAQRRRLPVPEEADRPISRDRNLWEVSLLLYNLSDTWEAPPEEAFIITCSPEKAPDRPGVVTVGFQEGIPRSLDGKPMEPLELVRELTRQGGEHGVGRNDVVEDRLFGLKCREFYEAPAPTILLTAHRDLQYLVHSREMIQLKESIGRRYAELVYMGLWFNDLRRSLQEFFSQTQRFVTGEVRLRLFKGSCAVLGRRSPHGLYDSQLAGMHNFEWLDSRWAPGMTSLWTLPARLAARRQPGAGGPPAADL